MANSSVRPSATSSFMLLQNSLRVSTSMAVVGSSSTISSDWPQMASAKRTRWVWPPDN